MPRISDLISHELQRKRIAWFSGFLSMLIAAFSIAGLDFFWGHNRTTNMMIQDSAASNKELQLQIVRLSENLALMQQAASASHTNLSSDRTAAVIAELSGQISNVTSRINSLEDAISASPEKALAIPMMRKDIETIQQNQTEYKTAIEGEIGRLYEFNKWFFGLIALMALSNAGLAFSAARGNKDKETKDTRPEI
jgi:hypothetical protein